MRPQPFPCLPLPRGWVLQLMRLLLLAALLGAASEHARSEDETQAAEYRIKAVFVCKFGNYIEWPPQAFAAPGTPFTIGVAGPDEVFNDIVQAAASLSVAGRSIAVRRLHQGDALAGVQLLFVARSQESALAEWLAAAQGLPIVTITESQQGLQQGSTINFVVVQDKVRFDVALPPAAPGTPKISSRLLSVARKVVTRGDS
jgi:hypothetical protein